MQRAVIFVSCALALALAAGPAAALTVHFPLSSSAVSDTGRGEIARLAATLAASPGQRVILAGHADGSGPEEFNRRLSHDRAAAVRRILVEEHRIAPLRVGITWLGSSQPLASDATAAGRARNRRVSAALVGSGEASPDQESAAMEPALPAPTETIEAVIERAHLDSGTPGETLALSYAPGATKLAAEEADRLAAFAGSGVQNATRHLLVTGVTPAGGDLLTTRRRVDAVRNLLVYLHGISPRQIMTGWSSAAGAAGDVLLQRLDASP